MKPFAVVFLVVAVSIGCNQNSSSKPDDSNIDDVDLLSSLWPATVKTDAALKQLGLAKPKWYDLQHDGMKIAIAIETQPSYGESYIDVYGYVFNRSFKEWRRFLDVKTRNAGHLELSLDSDSGIVVVRGAANNDLNAKPLLTFDLAAASDDRAYVDAEQ